MRIATWNVNSLRARLDHLARWSAEATPDVLCLQETKTEDGLFPLQEVQRMGFEHVAFCGQPTYNGVAILSRRPLHDVQKGLCGSDDTQRRLIAATVDGVRVYGLYVPNGSRVGSSKFAYKLRWLDHLRSELAEQCDPGTPLVVCGDLNVAPDDLDVWDPFRTEGQLLCHPEERSRIASLLEWGLVDTFRELHPFASEYSWWDYRAMGFQRNHGMRIDHLFATRVLFDRCRSATIHRDVRGWDQPSDHAPVVADFNA